MTRRALLTAAALAASLAAGCLPSRDEALGVRRAEVVDLVDRVAAYQAPRSVDGPPDWQTSPFYVGLLEAYDATGRARLLRAAVEWAQRTGWATGRGGSAYDDVCCGQVYLRLKELSVQGADTGSLREAVDAILAGPYPFPDGQLRRRGRDPEPPAPRPGWHYADAMFMMPPVLAQIHRMMGEDRYRDFLARVWWDTTDRLSDPETGLFYRDDRYTGPDVVSDNGARVFWSRANGWVVAGLVRVLEELPAGDAGRPRYEAQLRRMAESLAACQGPDGLWGTSLVDRQTYPHPESSGSAFFCYAMAWGIRTGILDRATFLPVVRRAWAGLTEAVDAEGRVLWVQPPAREPEAYPFVRGRRDPEVYSRDTPYGTGAWLMAAAEVARLAETEEAR